MQADRLKNTGIRLWRGISSVPRRIRRFASWLPWPVILFLAGSASVVVLYALDRTRTSFEEREADAGKPRLKITPSALGSLSATKTPFPSFIIYKLKQQSSLQTGLPLSNFEADVEEECLKAEGDLDKEGLEKDIREAALASCPLHLDQQQIRAIATLIKADGPTGKNLSQSLAGKQIYGEDGLTVLIERISGNRSVEKYLPALTDQVRSYPVFRASDGFFSELKLRSISLPANIVSLLDKNELAKEPIRASELRTKLSELSPDKGKEEEEMNEYWPYIERALTEPPSEAKPKGSLEASILSKEGELHAFYHAITMIITLTLIVSVVGLTAGLWRYGVAAVALSLHRGQPESTSLGSERAVVGAEEPGKMPEWLTKLLESSSGLVAILGVATLVTAGALAYNGGERAAAEAADKGSANQPAVPDNGSESTSRLPSDLYAQIAADRQAMINQMQEERFSWSREIQEERFSGSREIQALAAYTLEQQRSANERALTTLGQFEKVYDHSLETLVKSESTNLLNLGSTFESSLKSQAAYAAGSLSGLAMCCEPSKTSTNVVTQPTSQPSTEQTQSALLLSNLIALIGVRRAEDSISGAGEKLLQNKQMSDARNFPQRLKAFLVGVPISPTGPDGFICTSVFLPGVDKTVAGDIQLWMRGRQFKSFPSFSTELWGHLEEYFGPVTPGSKQYVWDGALTKEAFSKSQLARLQLYEMVLLSCCPQ